MKNYKNLTSLSKQGRAFLTIVITSMLVFFSGCEQSEPMSPDSMFSSSDVNTVDAKRDKAMDGGDMLSYPFFASTEVTFHAPHNEYRGATVDLAPTQSVFSFDGGALTPPDSIPFGDPVTITMIVDKDEISNELIFTFGPCGSQFSPSAELKLDYSDLGAEVPTLYYIDENGNYIEQAPDDIDLQNKRIIIFVNHFSRYALAHG